MEEWYFKEPLLSLKCFSAFKTDGIKIIYVEKQIFSTTRGAHNVYFKTEN